MSGVGPKKSQGLVYLAVKFFKGYTDATPGYSACVMTDREKHYGKTVEERRMNVYMGREGSKLSMSRPKTYKKIWGDKNGEEREFDGKLKLVYPNFHKLPNYHEVVAGSIFLGDYDLHGENIGVVRNPITLRRNDEKLDKGRVVRVEKLDEERLVRVDFGAAFRGNYWNRDYFQSDIMPYTRDDPAGLFHNPLRDSHMHPKSELLTETFKMQLEKICGTDVAGALGNAWTHACKVFKIDKRMPMKAFYEGTRIGEAEWDVRQEYTLEKLQTHFKKRKKSCGNLITEIRLFNAKSEDKLLLGKIVNDDEDYCYRLLAAKDKKERLPQLGSVRKGQKALIMEHLQSVLKPKPPLHRTASAPQPESLKKDTCEGEGASEDIKAPAGLTNHASHQTIRYLKRRLAASCWEISIFCLKLLVDLILVGILACFFIVLDRYYSPKNREMLIPRFR